MTSTLKLTNERWQLATEPILIGGQLLLEVVVPVEAPEQGEGPAADGDVGAALALRQAPLLPLHQHTMETLQQSTIT